MKCCKTCKHQINICCSVDYAYGCSKIGVLTTEPDRVTGKVIIKYKTCSAVLDTCDREGHYEPNLIQKFKNLFTGEN